MPGPLKEACASLRAAGRPARHLYLVPVGQNPTGTRPSEARYRDIYKVCCEEDLLLIEDDAYFYEQHLADQAGDEVPGLKLGMSYLSLDTEARVSRLDSFSKVLAPGFRI